MAVSSVMHGACFARGCAALTLLCALNQSWHCWGPMCRNFHSILNLPWLSFIRRACWGSRCLRLSRVSMASSGVASCEEVDPDYQCPICLVRIRQGNSAFFGSRIKKQDAREVPGYSVMRKRSRQLSLHVEVLAVPLRYSQCIGQAWGLHQVAVDQPRGLNDGCLL